jgi:hypothetical protein
LYTRFWRMGMLNAEARAPCWRDHSISEPGVKPGYKEEFVWEFVGPL